MESPQSVQPGAAIYRDIKRLDADTELIRKYGNRAVAHMSTRPLPAVTFDDLGGAVDDVVKMFARWSTILTGSLYYVDDRLPGDWKHPFRCVLFSGAFDHVPSEVRPPD
jgi:hypothetical protein